MLAGGYCKVQVGDELQDGRYKVLLRLGAGVYSMVWLVQEAVTGRLLAVKVLALPVICVAASLQPPVAGVTVTVTVWKAG